MLKKFNQEEFNKIKSLLNKGLSVQEVIKESGWSEWTVYVVKKVNSFEEFRNYKPQSKKQPVDQPVEGKHPKSLQFDIVARFLKGAELENFWSNYKNHTKAVGGMRRETVLQQPITQDDLELIKLYATDFETSLKEIASKKGIVLSSLYSRVLRISTKIIAQNPEILDKVITEG